MWVVGAGGKGSLQFVHLVEFHTVIFIYVYTLYNDNILIRIGSTVFKGENNIVPYRVECAVACRVLYCIIP